MTIKPLLADGELLQALQQDYGLVISKLSRLSMGADLNAAVYKAETQDQKAYFVKVKQGPLHDMSAALLSFLHQEGIEQVIPPLTTSQGNLTLPIDHLTLVVYPFIEHQNGFSISLTSNQWRMLGTILRKVHALKLPTALQNQIRKETYSSKWRDSVRSFCNDLEIHPHQEEDVSKNLLAFIKEHKSEMDQLVNTAELLSKQMMLQPSTECVLCHSDLHGGNVLIEENGSIYVVDWDEPILAPKERDLMFIGGGVANVWNLPEEESYFYDGYGTTPINLPALAYYRHERIVQDIAEYIQAILLSTKGSKEEREEMYQHFIDMFVTRGVVDIAFQTTKKLQ